MSNIDRRIKKVRYWGAALFVSGLCAGLVGCTAASKAGGGDDDDADGTDSDTTDDGCTDGETQCVENIFQALLEPEWVVQSTSRRSEPRHA